MDKPPEGPPKRTIKFDKEATNRVPAPKGIPDKYKNHRKSSIPFADRTPQVRFIKTAEQFSNLEIGSFSPSIQPSDAGKPILKKSSHPILVKAPHSEDGVEDKDNINWQIENSTHYVERVIQHFSSSDRETRGGLDILTYPISTSTAIQALARFYCGITVTIVCIEDLLIITAKNNREEQFTRYIKKVQESVKALLTQLNKFQKAAKTVHNRATRRSKQWGQKLMGKGQFHPHERRSSIIPVYTSAKMPENVTLYENEMEEDGESGGKTSKGVAIRSDGIIKFYRSEGDLAVLVEMKNDTIKRSQEDMTEKEGFALIDCLLIHVHELMYYATRRLGKAKEMLEDPIFDQEYGTLKERIDRFESDSTMDPLCALDLKSTLGEVITRKEELLNTSGHLVKYGESMGRLLKMFLRYCKTVGITGRNCWCGTRINSEKLFEEMSNVQGMDFGITMPLIDLFIKNFCHMEPKPSSHNLSESPSDKL